MMSRLNCGVGSLRCRHFTQDFAPATFHFGWGFSLSYDQMALPTAGQSPEDRREHREAAGVGADP
jgi:hypothetical protein